ncbi:MAG: sialate O-acetylesterase [Planctomycetota bacterium]|jgi:sialate O-acetylesterase
MRWITVCLLCLATLAAADLRLATPFGEHMVLQRQQPAPVWGHAAPGSTVTVAVAGVEATATAAADGRWRCDLPALEAGGPHTFTVTAGADTISFHDVLIGEVWICCGQSNMQMGYSGVPEVKQLVADTVAAKRPVRHLQVQQAIAYGEQDYALAAAWATTPPESAVAAGFACHLQAAIDVPVAVVVTAWGSSWLEGWMPRSLASDLPHFAAKIERDTEGPARVLCEAIIAGQSPGKKLGYPKDDAAVNTATDEFTALQTMPAKHVKRADIFARTRPNLLYNAMLHPLIPMASRGMVYYQGEANSKSIDNIRQYATSQPLWLAELRQRWGRDDWHFLGVMLPGFGQMLQSGPNHGDLEAVDAHSWAQMRASQLAILNSAHTGVACTIDLGDQNNIHPKDKGPIGERLALLARRDVLGEDILAQGPTLRAVSYNGATVTVTFDHATGLTTSDGAAPKAFWVSADGTSWHRADAAIDGTSVILTAPAGVAPQQVRYAHAAMPAVNLVNDAGLPAYPFATDS